MRNGGRGPRARLVWEGKPETVSPPDGAVLTRLGEVYPGGVEGAADNTLILGDNWAGLGALLPTLEGQVDLVYADPPFLSGNRFQRRVGRGEDSRKPETWLTDAGYDDQWADGDAYLTMLYTRLVVLYRLLKPTGTLYLHLDWHANGYARVLLDEIFGYDRLLNEIVWAYHGPSPVRSAFNRKHDTILVYTKSSEYTFNVDDVRTPYDAATVRTFASSKKAGFGKVPNLARGKVPEDWWYFPVVARLHGERTGYPTQKPEALLERVIRASSNVGDLVLDPFCGSGTTVAVAERLGRRWLGIDAAPAAIYTTQERLVRQGAQPFAVVGAHLPGEAVLAFGQPGGRVAVAVAVDGLSVQVRLGDYQPADGAAADERLATVVEPIESWAVDFAFDGLWRSRWQGQRQRGELPLMATWTYATAGEYAVVVQVTDVFGGVAEVRVLVVVG